MPNNEKYKINTFEFHTVKSAYKEYLSDIKGINSLQNFEEFLKLKNLSTKYADKLFPLILNDNKNILDHVKIEEQDFKTRKKWRVRDWLIKKGATLAGFVGGSIAGICSALVASQMPAGSMFMGIIPVTGNIAITAISAAVPMSLIGAGATVGFFKAKKAITLARYNKKYLSAEQSLKRLNQIENADEYKLPLHTLIEKISKSEEKVIKLRNGKWYTAPFRFIARHAINSVNRNRIHHVEQVTKDLLEMLDGALAWKKWEQDPEKYALATKKIENIINILFMINNSISYDVTKSKTHKLLTDQDMIEDIDIYSNLSTYIKTVTTLNPTNKAERKNKKQEIKEANKTTKRYDFKKQEAQEILNGNDRFIVKYLQRCGVLSVAEQPNPSFEVHEETVVPEPIVEVPAEEHNVPADNTEELTPHPFYAEEDSALFDLPVAPAIPYQPSFFDEDFTEQQTTLADDTLDDTQTVNNEQIVEAVTPVSTAKDDNLFRNLLEEHYTSPIEIKPEEQTILADDKFEDIFIASEVPTRSELPLFETPTVEQPSMFDDDFRNIHATIAAEGIKDSSTQETTPKKNSIISKAISAKSKDIVYNGSVIGKKLEFSYTDQPKQVVEVKYMKTGNKIRIKKTVNGVPFISEEKNIDITIPPINQINYIIEKEINKHLNENVNSLLMD